MAFITEDFQAYLNRPLEASEIHLPLDAAAYADLLHLLTDTAKVKNRFTYLTLKDDTHYETVKAIADGGYIIIQRGFGGTTAHNFPVGTCVMTISPTINAVIQLAAGGGNEFVVLQEVHKESYYTQNYCCECKKDDSSCKEDTCCCDDENDEDYGQL